MFFSILDLMVVIHLDCSFRSVHSKFSTKMLSSMLLTLVADQSNRRHLPDIKRHYIYILIHHIIHNRKIGKFLHKSIMNFFIDLRYLCPPLINLFTFLIFTSHHEVPYKVDILHYPILISVALLMLAIIVLLSFLFTSIQLPLIVRPIRLSIGNFSLVFAITLFSSIIFSPSLFWVVYLLLIVVSPWFQILQSHLKLLIDWLCEYLQSFPAVFIVCFPQNGVNIDPEIGRFEMVGTTIQNAQLMVVIEG